MVRALAKPQPKSPYELDEEGFIIPRSRDFDAPLKKKHHSTKAVELGFQTERKRRNFFAPLGVCFFTTILLLCSISVVFSMYFLLPTCEGTRTVHSGRAKNEMETRSMYVERVGKERDDFLEVLISAPLNQSFLCASGLVIDSASPVLIRPSLEPRFFLDHLSAAARTLGLLETTDEDRIHLSQRLGDGTPVLSALSIDDILDACVGDLDWRDQICWDWYRYFGLLAKDSDAPDDVPDVYDFRYREWASLVLFCFYPLSIFRFAMGPLCSFAKNFQRLHTALELVEGEREFKDVVVFRTYRKDDKTTKVYMTKNFDLPEDVVCEDISEDVSYWPGSRVVQLSKSTSYRFADAATYQRLLDEFEKFYVLHLPNQKVVKFDLVFLQHTSAEQLAKRGPKPFFPRRRNGELNGRQYESDYADQVRGVTMATPSRWRSWSTQFPFSFPLVVLMAILQLDLLFEAYLRVTSEKYEIHLRKVVGPKAAVGE